MPPIAPNGWPSTADGSVRTGGALQLKFSAGNLAVERRGASPGEVDITTSERAAAEHPEGRAADVAVERDLARILARALVKQFAADTAASGESGTDPDGEHGPRDSLSIDGR